MNQIEKGNQHKLRMTRSNGVYNFQMRIPSPDQQVTKGRSVDQVGSVQTRNRWAPLSEEVDSTPGIERRRYNSDFHRQGLELM